MNLHQGRRLGQQSARYRRLRFAERRDEWQGPTHAELAVEAERWADEREWELEHEYCPRLQPVEVTSVALRRALLAHVPINPAFAGLGPASAFAEPASGRSVPPLALREGARALGRRLAAHDRLLTTDVVDGRRVEPFVELEPDELARLAALAEHALDGDFHGLVTLALLREFWIRPLRAWTPPPGNPRQILVALAEHLMAERPAPRFLLNCLFSRSSGELDYLMLWVLLARRASISGFLRERAGDLDARLITPRVARLGPRLLQIPADVPPEIGVQYAQVLALGGTQVELRRLLSVRFGGLLLQDGPWSDFGVRAIRWLARHRDALDDLDAARIVAWAQCTGGTQFRWADLELQRGLHRARSHPRIDWQLRGRWDRVRLPASIATSPPKTPR